MMKNTALKDQLRKPPTKSKTLLSDIWYFLLTRPKMNTLIKFVSEEKRQKFNQQIMQRVGIEVDRNSVLNIHKIGIEAPVSYVFNELLNWNGDSTCWPNHVAKVERVGEKIEEIRILPFGWSKYPFGIKKDFLGLNLIPLFYLNSIRIKKTPDEFDFDNARYLLYKSSGGYPIGIFTMYVRSSIAGLGEKAHSQLIFAVSFNFYGKEKQANKLVNKAWENTHNRVTANVLNRIKQLSEWRIEKMENNQYL
ncbi:MAG: hypothetical protein HN778_19790 [Prolixibacteraceae bacterium]|jgi:hypothetical protein|nr:hypothetical protein [Prolixibacteraceae bacterium]MBT6764904.1 hypothetical protein [Prolixibacteraceae bacterium]MBT6996992.1 hypothetical protein [Prolixibacteraceae bacterium]MBT7397080.1 hypothetical protein [Prolixibacteraceae bacterium]